MKLQHKKFIFMYKTHLYVKQRKWPKLAQNEKKEKIFIKKGGGPIAYICDSWALRKRDNDSWGNKATKLQIQIE